MGRSLEQQIKSELEKRLPSYWRIHATSHGSLEAESHQSEVDYDRDGTPSVSYFRLYVGMHTTKEELLALGEAIVAAFKDMSNMTQDEAFETKYGKTMEQAATEILEGKRAQK